MKKKRLLLMLLTLLCFIGGAKAQNELTVYEGTATNRNVPAYIFYFDDFTKSQFVIPAGDLTPMNGGTISKIKFYTTSSNIPYETVSTVDVYLKEVDYTTMTGLEAKSSATTVYQGTLSVVSEGSGGSLTIELSTPYTYGGGNLLIGIENTTDAGYKSIYFYGQTVTGAAWAGYNSGSLDAVTGSVQNFIPQTTFTYTPGIYYAKPTNVTVSDLAPKSATISWTAPEGATSYFYQYKEATQPEEDYSDNEASTNATSVTLNGLTSGTTYNFRVKAIYSGGESTYATKNFTTDCVAASLPFTEDFEGSINCWSLVNCSNYSVVYSDCGRENSRGFVFSSNATPPQYLISPEFEGTSGVGVSFWYANYNSAYPETFQVGYSTTDKDPTSFTWDEEITAEDEEWTLYENSFPVGTKYVAVRYNSKNKSYLFLDDFSFTVSDGVVNPTNLSTTEIGTTSAKLNWEGTHDSYVIQYRTAAQDMNLNAWHQIGNDIVATGTLTQYSFDLSAYSGTGCIAIRHYNISDMFKLNVDDIVVTNAGGTEILTEDFESGAIPAGWGNVDLDGDGYKWTTASYDDDGYQHGSFCVYSASWDEYDGALTPDNWLIIPNVELGGTLTFYARGCDPIYPDENFAVLVTTESLENVTTAVDAGAWSSDIQLETNTYQLTGLTANTPYDWRVKGIVGSKESNWKTSSFTTIQEGFKTFVTDGNWDVANNWFPVGVPALTDEVSIEANVTIPSGVVAVAKRAAINGGSITIKDGAQLKQGAATLKVTMEKGLTGYGDNEGVYNFIASPFTGTTKLAYSSTWSHVLNLTSGDFDLYGFDSTESLEWINYKVGDTQNAFTSGSNHGLKYYDGYLYANKEDKTLEFTGTTPSSLNNAYTVDVTFDNTSTDEFNGWKLIGNPFTCNGYVYYVDGSDNLLSATFYKMNAAGDGYDVYEDAIMLAPGEGAFIKVSASGTIKYSSENLALATIAGPVGTATLPDLPIHGLETNQDANEKVAITMNEYGIMTYASPRQLDFSNVSDLKAYAATDIEDDNLTMTTVNVAPAEAGLMLKGTADEIFRVPVTTAAADDLSANKLVGLVEATFVPVHQGDYTTYILANGTDGVNWYQLEADYTLKANSAYLKLTSAEVANIGAGARGLGMIFDDGTTAIQALQSATMETENGAWYTLQGLRLDKQPTTKGIYIHNGRKVVIK